MSKIFIELPTWLGDGVMATPAIENLLKIYPDVQLTVFGSFVATELFKHHPKIERIIVDTSKQSSNRLLHLYKTARALGKFDLALSFRSSFASTWLLFCLSAHKKALYRRTRNNCENGIHQVIRYNNFVNCALGQNLEPADLTLFTKPLSPSTHRKPLLGLNPGSTYGSAKRWYPNEFAQVAIVLSQNFDIVILGGPKEKDIAHDIEQLLIEQNVVNVINRAGTMSIEQLIEQIAQLDILLTNDSGPMHVAAAFKIKTVAIFGPTNHIETHQWHNPNEFILRKPTECAPCMQRECPLKHHRCMKEIHAEDVLLALANKGWI